MHTSGSWGLARWLLFLALVLPAWTTHSQSGPQPQLVPAKETQTDLIGSGPAASVAPIHAQATRRTYLPIVISSPVVGPLQFASSVDANGAPVDPATTFNYGIQYLYISVTVTAGKNLPWRTEWTVDGNRQTGLDRSGTVSSSLSRITNSICYGPTGICGSAVPRGTYQVNFFLNNQLVQQGTAVIR